MYRVLVDTSLCSGFGSCAELAPETFELGGAVATVRAATTDDPAVLEAAASCPMGAITVVLDDTLERAA